MEDDTIVFNNHGRHVGDRMVVGIMHAHTFEIRVYQN